MSADPTVAAAAIGAFGTFVAGPLVALWIDRHKQHSAPAEASPEGHFVLELLERLETRVQAAELRADLSHAVIRRWERWGIRAEVMIRTLGGTPESFPGEEREAT